MRTKIGAMTMLNTAPAKPGWRRAPNRARISGGRLLTSARPKAWPNTSVHSCLKTTPTQPRMTA
jgi:hypothetical protein